MQYPRYHAPGPVLNTSPTIIIVVGVGAIFFCPFLGDFVSRRFGWTEPDIGLNILFGLGAELVLSIPFLIWFGWRWYQTPINKKTWSDI